MTARTAADRVWWAPFDSLPGQCIWHALKQDPCDQSTRQRAWAVCDWVGYVHFNGNTLPPIFCVQCWRVVRRRWSVADHQVVTPERWRAGVRGILSGGHADDRSTHTRGRGGSDAEAY